MDTEDTSVAVAFIVVADILMYLTLPLHIRLLHVLVKPRLTTGLDGSFHTLMINTTLVNLIFSLVYCLIQEPAATGLFFNFYNFVGPVIAKIEMTKSTVLLLVGVVLHLVLGANRFSAIAFPTKHAGHWRGNKLLYFCIGMWSTAIVLSIPLLLPGSTAHIVTKNVFGLDSVEFTFLGNYYQFYSMGCSFTGAFIEIIALLFYVGMLFKFRDFRKYTKTGESKMRKLSRGVVRTTFAACIISLGSWIIVAFFAMIYGAQYANGYPVLTDLYFSATFRLLNVINNVLTPWVLLIVFPHIRKMILITRQCNNKAAVGTVSGNFPITNQFQYQN